MLLGSCTILAGLSPSPASAGTYTVYACGSGGNGSWTASTSGANVAAYSNCPFSGGDTGIKVRNAGNGPTPYGSQASQAFFAAPGTSIVGVGIEGAFCRGDASWQISLIGTPGVLWSAPVTGCAAMPSFGIDPSSYVALLLRCGPSGNGYCPTDGSRGATANITQSWMTLSDPSPPAFANGRGLWSDDWHKLPATVVFDSWDASGISHLRLFVDGALHADDDWANGDCSFWRPKPCTDVSSGWLPIHTDDGVGDGRHVITLQATDAAGNVSTVSRSIYLDTTAPPPAEVVDVDGGQDWSAAQQRTISIVAPAEPQPTDSDPAGQSPITVAYYKLCPASNLACPGPEQPLAFPAGQSTATARDIRVPAPGDYVAIVRLVDAAGNSQEQLTNHTTHLRYDPAPPKVSIDPLNPSDPGTLTAHVGDDLSGVADGEIQLAPAGTNHWRSLPSQVHGNVLSADVDDTTLPDGQYDERVVTEDRAGNAAVAARDRAVPIPFRLTTRLQAGFVKRRVIHKHHRKVVKTRLTSGLTVRYHRYADLAGTLQTKDGQPVANAQVVVKAQAAAQGATPETVGAVTTDKDGRFTYRTLARLSRTLTFAYDGTRIRRPAAASVNLAVPATSSIHVNRRHVLNGDTVRFSGRLTGGHVPPGGKLVAMEVLVRGTWQPFANVHTDPTGAWHVPHTFTTVAGRARFEFRLAIPHDDTYPFAGGRSKRLALTVSGL